MRRRFKVARPSPALVIAVLALVLALAGVSYAVVKSPKNSVVTKSIKSGAVTLPKIAKSAQSALKGQTGATGEKGAPGVNGAPGANGATNVVVRTGNVSVPNGFALSQKVQCGAGQRATGGGVSDPGTNANSRVTASAPLNSGNEIAGAGETPTGWLTQAFNGSGSTIEYTVYVICASP